MACESWKERLVALLYDELDADERRDIEGHLAGCAGCRAELDELASARSLLAEARFDAPPVSPRVMVLAPKSVQRPWLAFAAGILFAVLLMGGGAAIGMSFAAPERETPVDPPQLAIERTPPEFRETQPVSLAQLNQELAPYRDRLDQCTQDNQRLSSLVQGYDDRIRTYQTQYRDELGNEMAKLGQVLDLRRATDVDMLLREIADAEYRANNRIGKTEERVRYIVLSAQPGLSEN
jgi:hypothetical protein